VRAAAIIPVKRFGAAKQRLAAELEPSARVRLAGAMLEDVLAAVDATPAVERMIVVTGEPAATRAARAHGAEVIDDPADRGHSRAARLGVERAVALDFEVAALVPGDCPLLDSAELDAAVARLSPPEVAVVPDRHGTGTNALLLAPPDAIAPAFGEGSRARHEGLARAAGVAARVAPLASLAPDVDTADDLAAVAALLRERPAGALRTAAAIRALGVEDRA
jgi:2-phospho-L-lactate/phosphoenolpyruvate guanylyltransferase